MAGLISVATPVKSIVDRETATLWRLLLNSRKPKQEEPEKASPPPLFVSRLDPHIAPELSRLRQFNARDFSAAEKTLATGLLTDALHGILDTVFTRLIQDIDTALDGSSHQAQAVRTAEESINNVKDKIDHYMGWVVKFLSGQRLVVTIEHYDALVHQLPGTNISYAAFELPTGLAERAAGTLADMKSGRCTNTGDAIELLIEFIDVAVDPMIRVPMELMQFSFLVERTLNGVLSLGITMIKKMLRKLPPVLPKELLPVLARHMEAFLVPDASTLNPKITRMPEPACVRAGHANV